MNVERLARLVAVAVAGLFTAIAIRYASFAAAISDGSGYVSEAMRWLRSDLFVPQLFAFWPGWQVHWAVPLGYRTGPVIGADVFTYPPGLPMTMAAAMAWGGELAAYLVPPVMGGLLVWAAGDLADRLAGPRARVLAAALMATSAIALLMAAQPMSDVPAAAWWALALTFSLRGQTVATLAAGLAVSMAVLTRPNLTPLAVVPAVLVVLAAPARRLFLGGLFGSAAVLGPVLLMWMQHVLYGSAWTLGHLGVEQTFSLANAWPNLSTYVPWYAEAHTPVVVLAVLAPVVFWRTRSSNAATVGVTSRQLVLALLVVVVAVYMAYLFYAPWDDWLFLRFMLPAFAPLYALTAAVLARGLDRLPRAASVPALVVVLALTAGLQAWHAYERGLTTTPRDTARVPAAGHYLDAMLPPNAIVVTAFHSGSIRHYTGRSILRPDGFSPDLLGPLLARLELGGYHPYLLLDDWLERAPFLAIFKSSRFGALDWAPRALIGSHGRIVLYDTRDRERHARGERWPTDVVR